MKCNQSRPGFELVSPCPFPTVTFPPSSPTLHQPSIPFPSLRPVINISLPLHQIQPREREEKEQTEQTLGVNSSAKGELCNTLCMYRLTLAWVTSETSTKQLECRLILTRSSLTGLDPISPDWSHRSSVDCPCPCPVANSCELLCPTNSLPASPSTSGHVEISSPKPFVWFRAKTDKGIVCLAGHLHSVTLRR